MFEKLPAKMQKQILKAAQKAYRPGKKARSEKEVVKDICIAAFKAVMKD